MRILSCLVLFGVVIAAQTPRKKTSAAPRPAEAVLRGRITGFYQAHVDGKFRQADQFVAPESKDAFFEADKQRLLSFQIQNIAFENATHAKATVLCEFNQFMPVGGITYKVKLPRVSLWKLIGRTWYWYTVPTNVLNTPFGPVKVSSERVAASAQPSSQDVPQGPGVKDVLNRVVAEQTEVRLYDSEPSTGEITIRNGLPGSIRVTVMRHEVPGLELKVEKEFLAFSEKGRVLFRYTPPEKGPKQPKVIFVQIEPTGEILSVNVIFTPAQPAQAK